MSTGSFDYSPFCGHTERWNEVTINNLIGSENTAKVYTSTECTHSATGQHLIEIVNNANTTTCTSENTVKNLHNSTFGSWSSQDGSPHMVIGIAATDGANVQTKTQLPITTTSTIPGSIR